MGQIHHNCQCKLIRSGGETNHDMDHFPAAMGWCLDQMRQDPSIKKVEIRMRADDGRVSRAPIWAIRNVHHREPEGQPA